MKAFIPHSHGFSPNYEMNELTLPHFDSQPLTIILTDKDFPTKRKENEESKTDTQSRRHAILNLLSIALSDYQNWAFDETYQIFSLF